MPSITCTCRGHERRQKKRRDAITQNGLSFLRIVDEGAINCKRGAPFLIVYSSTARRLFNAGSMQHSDGFKRSKRTILFADADTIISVHRAGQRHASCGGRGEGHEPAACGGWRAGCGTCMWRLQKAV